MIRKLTFPLPLDFRGISFGLTLFLAHPCVLRHHKDFRITEVKIFIGIYRYERTKLVTKFTLLLQLDLMDNSFDLTLIIAHGSIVQDTSQIFSHVLYSKKNNGYISILNKSFIAANHVYVNDSAF